MRAAGWYLPFNPAGQTAVAPDLSFNTAISFITNTNWQNYGGESTMSYLVQMLGLTHQNFLSAATGIVLAIALDPRLRAALGAQTSAISGSISRAARSTSCIPICVPYALVPGLAGHAADARRLTSTRRRSKAPSRPSPSGPVASQNRDQDAGHQWRRLFQRQLRAPVRESDRVVELRADDLDLRARGGADQCVRPHGRRPAPGLGHLRRHGRAVPRRRHRLLCGRSARQRRALNALGLTGGNMEGKEVALRHCCLRAVRRDHHRLLPAARSMPCTTASPRSAA